MRALDGVGAVSTLEVGRGDEEQRDVDGAREHEGPDDVPAGRAQQAAGAAMVGGVASGPVVAVPRECRSRASAECR
ncbi:hypothetical protein GCM10025864_40440 [Luteimicrobium album]|uniref:Uncharacterized protein n=1 Tax=Luteimicrobium album TaxID=1054550 RepID=A0ABQ6I6Y7_9MICO|nr:hypothetical protein GCM10025864_40440 [Luteimicrobium album]